MSQVYNHRRKAKYSTRVKLTDPDCIDPPRCSEPLCRSTDVYVEQKADSVVVVCQVCHGVETISHRSLTAGEREWLKKNPSTWDSTSGYALGRSAA